MPSQRSGLAALRPAQARRGGLAAYADGGDVGFDDSVYEPGGAQIGPDGKLVIGVSGGDDGAGVGDESGPDMRQPLPNVDLGDEHRDAPGIDLTAERAALPPDPIDSLHNAHDALLSGNDEFYGDMSSRVLSAPDRMRDAFANSQDMQAQARNELVGSGNRINDKSPWLDFAGAVLQPSSSPMGSVGKGLLALNAGRRQIAQQHMGVDQLLAKFDNSNASQDFGQQMGMEKFNLNALDTATKLKMIQAKLRFGVGPQEVQLYNWVNQAATPQEKQARMEMIRQIKGTAQQKNATDILGGGDYGGMVARLQTQPYMSKFLSRAVALHPAEAYQGQDPSLRFKDIYHDALKMAGMTPEIASHMLGTPSASASPAAAAANPAAQPAAQPAVQPAASPDEEAAAAAAAQPAAAAQSAAEQNPEGPSDADIKQSPWLKYLGSPIASSSATKPGVIPDKAQQAAQVETAKESTKQAQDYYSKTVVPASNTAQGVLQDATVAEGLLKQDPRATGPGASAYGKAANWAQWITGGSVGVDKAKNWATFMSLMNNEVLNKQVLQKGPQTESDAARMAEAGLKISDPVAKNQFVVRAMKATALRAQAEANFFSQWEAKNQGDIRGAREAWTKYTAESPVVRLTKNNKPVFWNEERDFNLQQQQ